ncbi:hypothetical protein ALC62_10163 [Cyphomyrmex costatus]|uniref:DDE-1 domain-containing protein n=1 Tax=Cyphomyrmex costatus TaxID=456900 RepID=A0A151IEE4_9HYME|nr:hypothetical protein ALC62_10163 [Cyphomyrmex costatus]
MTLVVCVSAAGMKIPPFFVFPGKRFQPHYLNGAPSGSVGSVNPSWWINSDLFLEFLKHLKNVTRCSVDQPVLLLLDNHESNRSLPGLQFCKANGIHVVSFPPHYSHRLQPLDVSVFGPFKTAMHKQYENFMRMHPGRGITIPDIPQMINRALEVGGTEINIKSGFRATGIWPLDTNIFQDIDYLPSATTNRDFPADIPNDSSPLRHSTPRSSSDHVTTSLSETLQSIEPHPKAPPRISSKRRGRKPGGRSCTLTDDSVMAEITESEKSEQRNRTKLNNRGRNKKLTKSHNHQPVVSYRADQKERKIIKSDILRLIVVIQMINCFHYFFLLHFDCEI